MKKPNDLRAAILLFLIMALGLALLSWMHSGPFVFYDDTIYLNDAHLFLQSGALFQGDAVLANSIGYIAMLAFFVGTFGYNVFSTLVFGVSTYILLVMLTFLCGRALYNNTFALIAALFAATSPFVLEYGTRVLPDNMLGVISALSILLLVYAIKKEKKELFFLAGLFAALIIFVRLDGFMFIGFYLLSFLASNLFKRTAAFKLHLGYFLIGVSVSVLVYLSIVYVYTGNPTSGMHAFMTQQSLRGISTISYNVATMLLLLNPVPTPPISSPPYFPTQINTVGAIVLLSVLGSVVALYKKHNLLAVPSLLTIGIFFYFIFGSSSLSLYAPIPMLNRYLAMIAAPVAIMSTYLIYHLYNYVRKRSRTYAVLSVIAFILLTLLSFLPAYANALSYNLPIRNQTALYVMTLNKISSITGNQSSTVFTYGEANGLPPLFLQFLSGYDKYLNISPLGNSCMPTNSAFVVTTGTTGQSYQQIYLNYLNTWAGGNCTLSLISNFQSGSEDVALYISKPRA